MAGIALLLPGSQSAVGGAPMRWRALRDALIPFGCNVHEIDCDRRADCVRVCAKTAATSKPITPPIWYHNRKFCPAYADALLEQLTGPDGVSTIICSGLETFEYVRHFSARGTVRVIYDMHNIEHQLYRDIQRAAPAGSFHAGLFSDEHIAMVAAAETAAVTSASAVWCCSPDDRLALLSAMPGTEPAKVRVVPNVVPVPLTQPAFLDAPRHACFVGRMDHYPNMVAARLLISEVAPLMAAGGSPMQIVIAGANLGTEVGASGGNIKLICDPPDIGPILRHGVMLVPLTIGSGSRLKILEAFAAGVPVVSTAKGVEGLDVKPGIHYLPAETGEQFASAALTLASDGQLRSDVTTRAWMLVRDRYSVRALAAQLAAGGDL